MKGYYKPIIEQLLAHGWLFFRQGKGSHEIWHKPGIGRVTVAVTCTSRMTANEIMKSAKIPHRFR